MKRHALGLFLLVIFVLTLQRLSAQHYFYNDRYYDNPVVFEFGGSVGLMNSLTDLGGNKGIGRKFIKDLNLRNSHFSGSIYFSVTYQNMIGVRIEGTFGKVSAADSVLKPVAKSTFFRYERNLSFRSNITEIAAIGEVHPLVILRSFDNEAPAVRLSPYLLAGIGIFSFNPEAKLENRWVALQPLRTEGQGFKEYPGTSPYKLTDVCLPIGAGARYDLSPMFNVRAEFIYRATGTDYLDDVSGFYTNPAYFRNNLPGYLAAQAEQLHSRRYEIEPGYQFPEGLPRGNPKHNDAYLSFNLKLGLVLGRKRIK
jgi:hypothetical protein